MTKTFCVLYAVLAVAIGLMTGLVTVGLGETSALAVMTAVGFGMAFAVPASWFLSHTRAGA